MMNKQLLVASVAILSIIGSVFTFKNFKSTPDSAPYELLAMADHEKLASGQFNFKLTNHSAFENTSFKTTAKTKSNSGATARNIFAPAINAVAIAKFLNGNLPTTTPTGNIAIPTLLSQTGAFQNLNTLEVSPGVIPYDMIEPFWSDGAIKTRWMAIPNDGTHNTPEEQIQFSMDNAWDIPRGAVLIKHFELPGKRLETRFEVKGDDDVYYYLSYKWNDAQTDAELIDEAVYEDVVVNGVTQSWHYPGRNECASCHYAQNGNVLGPKTRNLNKSIVYPSSGIEMNQLVNLSELGILDENITLNNVDNYPAVAAKNDLSRSLEDRARSYIDMNCASCHNPQVDNIATFDARYTTPLENQNIIYGPVAYDEGLNNPKVIIPQDVPNSMAHFRMNSTQSGTAMPPIAKDVVDAAGVALIAEWINSLSPTTTNAPIANFSVSTGYGAAPLSVTFDGTTSTDADGDNLTFAWNFGDGTTSQGSITNHIYTNPGSYLAILTVSDGTQTDMETTTIVVNNTDPGSDVVGFTEAGNLLNGQNNSGLPMGIVDMNGDGKDDIVQFDDAKNLRIQYQQIANQAFTSHSFGQVSDNVQWSTAIADYDHNGYNDILSGGFYDDIRIISNNNGNDSFSMQTLANSSIFIQGSNFADIDNDGWVDIFACHDHGESTPFKNNTNGTFTYDANLIRTNTIPTSDNSGNYASMWIDYDNDNDLDLYISKCRGGVTDPTDPRRINMLFQNDGNNNYTEVAEQANLKIGEQTWLTDFGDIDNDGDLDAIIINHYSGPNLMRNNGNGTFTEVTASSGLLPHLNPDNITGLQGFLKDFNNDGFLDLMVSGNNHMLFYNNGDGTFAIAPNPFSSEKIHSFSVGDLNHDGFLDIYSGYSDGLNTPSNIDDTIWLNQGNSNNFIAVQLEGTSSNINGIGARVEIHGAWGIQIRDVRSGEGYGIMNSFTQHFGIGAANQVDKIVVRWPSGIVDEILNPSTNQFLAITESQANTSVTGVTVSPDIATLTEGNTQQLTATVSPTDASNTSVNWTSSNTAIATVNTDGLVTAISAGSATITVTTNDGSFTATSAITVEANTIEVTGISINLSTATLIEGNTQALVATVQPTNASNQNITWISSNNAIATVNQNGLVTAISEGNTTITATTNEGSFTVSSEITVEAASVGVSGISISPNNSTISIGNNQQLTATVSPTNASNQGVQWSSNNTNIATVDASGLVTALTAGNATITATTNDGNYSANATILIESVCEDCQNCPTLNFNDHTIISYSNQDNGPTTIQDNGSTLFLTGNAWKALEINYNVTPNTVLKFDFKSTVEGEIHEIGFDTDNILAPNLRIVTFGDQGYDGDVTLNRYDLADDWKTYTINVGQEITGAYQYLVLTADDDANSQGNSYLRNVSIYEDVNGNGVSDSCETEPCTDSDNDGVCDDDDSCEGSDDNLDADDDGVPDGCDTCTSGDDTVDTDSDGIADTCDICQGSDDNLDSDGDGVPDGCDTCTSGDDTVDTDSDGIADTCDICQGSDDNLDTDGDGVPNGCDTCEGGDDSIDTDGDGIPDFCDTTCVDTDNDGVCDTDDICEGGDDNIDTDGDGIPDFCDTTSCTEVNLSITFDRYARETTWQLNDENGVAVLSGGGYTTAQNSTTINETVCLPVGCYDFVINDSYGDGVCCAYGQGSYNITDTSGTVLASGGEFTYSEISNFCIDDGGESCDLTGQSCDDGNACTTGETYDTDCNCTGGTITDSDGDGVCDEDDICQGGDDTADTDGDGIPDFCDTTECTFVTVNLTFDDYAREVSWQLNDTNGEVVLSGSGYSDADDFTTINESICLPAGCYDFVINDTYGDGICCRYGEGSYEVRDENGSILASGGNYTSSETTNFCLNNAGNSTGLRAALPPYSSLTLSPVPADNILNMEHHFALATAEETTLTIFDITGRLVLNKTISKGYFDREIDISQFTDGVYILKLSHGDETLVKQFIVKH